MAGWVAGAIILGSAYTANEARKARKDAESQQRQALQQQASDAAAMREQVAKQNEIYSMQAASLKDQADLARQQFEQGSLQYKENKLAMEKKASEVQAAADEERRKAAAAEASALKARTRCGRRALLSQERLTPELGIESPQLGTRAMV
jgi:colicin import membrane protein